MFKANLYTIENGIYRELMIYWYQGRGHFEASEYRDNSTPSSKRHRRRTDGALVRVMTSVGPDEPASLAAAKTSPPASPTSFPTTCRSNGRDAWTHAVNTGLSHPSQLCLKPFVDTLSH